jgi:hypothetical protein
MRTTLRDAMQAHTYVRLPTARQQADSKTSVVITDQAFGGRSSCKAVMKGLKRGFSIPEVS